MSQKREQLLDTALDLFYRLGINSIGINEILKESGVAKRTLYSHFNSKDELILAALNRRHQTFIYWLEGKLDGVESDRELVDVLFTSLNSWFTNNERQLGDFRGCFFINTSAEFSDPNSDISRYCKHHKEQVRQLIKSKLKSDSEELLDAICLLKEGTITTAYVTGNFSHAISSSLNILRRF
ncbi:putative Transcriptional regulator, TetR family [Vibrio nigripulchritudo SO65]|uniref:TetR/AcrR family transcriptional regulator n=1 Tax=Vibrio nigripulchritudo TaxID=28173 RepID=UPI0003B22FDA|nr:TetR/AcrR family transcriptional regulator [Vibrio nigripulchritudo]CCN34187.1 putative Transcriptional regulator, TetR family [Vibrio nigripulchritudo AM115]CCN44002.1 putative Transcriptional regulator, TetR family [Vibrio nigripulchritudo FTn2]CCN66904.1 putative Transcriptional regulator, TetR family [Vibrio nigripulchritudo POn4]CCN76667.1 putative Transcriptional regulator, TetR family [Vibrio nigripulchritudo SO65]